MQKYQDKYHINNSQRFVNMPEKTLDIIHEPCYPNHKDNKHRSTEHDSLYTPPNIIDSGPIHVTSMQQLVRKVSDSA